MRWPVVLVLGGAAVLAVRILASPFLPDARLWLSGLVLWIAVASIAAGLWMSRGKRTSADASYRPAWPRFWSSAACGAVGALVAFRVAQAPGFGSLYGAWLVGALVAVAGALIIIFVPRNAARPMRSIDRAVTLWMWVPGFLVCWLLLWFFTMTASPTAAG